ncbi:MAG TPA: protoporphyrinogen oxidase [Phycisphaerae bacterium]|nr:protoporphyrinogen oxidase [Phycisphaerae bacterium]HRY69927.1 protoporphyrinogen oxidase [Phycisphaerae bacterium]HSA27136.1 protoporphyrinogen oxidase [Phycisphaerae bacterium]
MPKRVIVVGGGIAGLAAAHRVVERAEQVRRPVHITLLESTGRLGGSIVTHRRDGFLVEGGPDSFITQKPWAIALCKRLGIDSQIIPTDADRRRVYVVRRGRLFPIPEGFLLLAPTRIMPFVTSRLFSWPGKIRMGLDVILPAKKRPPDGDESLADFVRRRFGREALERIAQPLVGGIYTADPEALSLRTTMPRFLELEDRYRSVILGMRAGRKATAARGRGDSGARYSMFVSFDEGMATLTDTLIGRLPPETARTRTAVDKVERTGLQWRVLVADGSTETADAVILACPSHASAKIVEGIDPMLGKELEAIKYASSATMTMAFRRDRIRHPLDGFGFVVPSVENRSMIAGTFGSIKFAGRAPNGWVLMRTFLGGAIQPHIYEMEDKELRRAVLKDLAELIGAEGEPRFTEIHRWPLSMPQYPVGHLERVKRIEQRLAGLPGLAVAGNAFGGVGIPDCVQSGEQAANRVLGTMSDER